MGVLGAWGRLFSLAAARLRLTDRCWGFQRIQSLSALGKTGKMPVPPSLGFSVKQNLDSRPARRARMHLEAHHNVISDLEARILTIRDSL